MGTWKWSTYAHVPPPKSFALFPYLYTYFLLSILFFYIFIIMAYVLYNTRAVIRAMRIGLRSFRSLNFLSLFQGEGLIGLVLPLLSYTCPNWIMQRVISRRIVVFVCCRFFCGVTWIGCAFRVSIWDRFGCLDV